MGVQFSNDIERNLQIIGDLLTELSPPMRQKVRAIANEIDSLVKRIAKDNPKDPVAGLGVAYAVHYIAQNMTQRHQDGADTNTPLIQLLN